MIRVIIVAIGLSFATSARAAEPKPKAGTSQKAKPGKAGPLSEAKRNLFNAKRALVTAVALCSAPGKCEQGARNADREYITMLEGADRNFIEACLACSTSEKCDAERDRIKDGKRSPGTIPCD
ncbi:MAG TPA: hypothetical protein VF832_12760 [Longimicrobiales bacterium]